MESERTEEIERYIQDWYWSDQSHKFAYDFGEYLFGFMDYLEESGLSERTIKKHRGNCWCIGILICQYGYHGEFSPQILAYPPYQDIEFRRKFSDSKYQVQSYNSTCKKLEKYALKKGDLSYKKDSN
mgnify:FL=1